MDELEFYNGLYTGQQIDDSIGRTGYAKLLTAEDNLNSLYNNGFYYWTNAPLNAPESGFGYAYMIVIRRSDVNCVQIVFRGGNQIVMRQIINETPSAWEWVSGMPMTPDVEYETTERVNGKVVYCKTVSIASVATGNTLAATFLSGQAAHGTILRHSVFGQLTATNWINMPYDNGSTLIKVNPLYYSNGNTWSLRLYINTNAALSNVTATLWYTKD